ncbi:beta-ketoacyl synthase N-terminal-like domain-containing protein [Streptomyces spirodelae]|uniref:3-oxoacyl-ACP synthase n=1 Tax=Streptomyces spirodelae TaxID=2812904 RepID=A0ABS3WLJ6_9ACTN|nr:beta-ketoacyl synthase N-terminal-like domain-containing protein [Streptomyces spirodelae]MBO8183995.1 3-oxoacyl-ACP synthase [Streptomyces spirodelae]
MGPVITAWSAISPFGFGADAFRAGLRAGVPAPASATGPVPDAPARPVPDFAPRAVLGKKGTRSMDRVTALSVAAIGALMDRGDAPGASADGPAPGLVLGTTGSVQSTMDFTRSSLDGARPFHVDPARFPNTVMNCAAGQCAIWHGLKGPNATIAGGRAAGLLALNYARRLQAGGRAGTLFCGGAEEFSEARARLHHHSPGAPDGTVLGEGAAVLRLEPAGSVAAERDGLAEVVALEFGMYEEAEEIPATLLRCLRRALERAGARPMDVALVAPGAGTGAGGDSPERAALCELFGGRQPAEVDCTGLVGDTAAASAAFQVLAVLVRAEQDPALADRPALVTAVDHDGTLGCALLRPYPAR